MSVSPALAQLPSDAKQGLMESLQQHPEAGSGGHKAPANRGSYKPGQIVPARFCAPSLLPLEVCMWTSTSVPDAANRAHFVREHVVLV